MKKKKIVVGLWQDRIFIDFCWDLRHLTNSPLRIWTFEKRDFVRRNKNDFQECDPCSPSPFHFHDFLKNVVKVGTSGKRRRWLHTSLSLSLKARSWCKRRRFSPRTRRKEGENYEAEEKDVLCCRSTLSSATEWKVRMQVIPCLVCYPQPKMGGVREVGFGEGIGEVGARGRDDGISLALVM